MFKRLKASAERRLARLAGPGKLRAAALCTGLMVAAATTAAPAPWFLWRSKLTGELYCAQTLPGQGWSLSDGPFKDLACQQRGRPGR